MSNICQWIIWWMCEVKSQFFPGFRPVCKVLNIVNNPWEWEGFFLDSEDRKMSHDDALDTIIIFSAKWPWSQILLKKKITIKRPSSHFCDYFIICRFILNQFFCHILDHFRKSQPILGTLRFFVTLSSFFCSYCVQRH